MTLSPSFGYRFPRQFFFIEFEFLHLGMDFIL